MKWVVIAVTFLLLAILAFTLVVQKPGAAGPQHQVFEARLSTSAMVEEAQTKHWISTSIRIYDRQGHQVAEGGGGVGDKGLSESFRNVLDAVLRNPEVVGSKTLAWELGRIEKTDGHPLGKIRDADFTIVKYFFKFCDSCEDQNQRDIKALMGMLASYNYFTINIWNVDADILERVKEQQNKDKQH